MKVHLLNADLYHFPLPFGLNVGFGQLGLDSGVVFDRHKATSEYQDFYYAYRHRHEEVTRLVQKGTPLTKALKEVPWPEDVGKSKSADSSAKRLHELWISQACQAFYERQREREAAEKFRKSPIDYPAHAHRRPQFRFV